jgi:transposase
MTFLLTPGQAHELSAAEYLFRAAPIPSGRAGRPRWRPQRVVGDKGYSSPRFRAFLRQQGICVTIPHRADQSRRGPFDRAVYRLRNQVERLINRLKQFRRIATRYEKRAANFAAMLAIAATLHWLKFAYTP